MAWTSITAGFDWQNKSFINELVGGVNERVQGLWAIAPYSLVTKGQDIQAYIFWQNLQNSLESCIGANKYLDDQVTIAGSSSLTFLDQATWYSRAGFTVDGWRRATEWNPAINDWTDINDSMYSYGLIQAGDIIGPWLFVDLQNAMTALKWTFATVGADIANYPDNHGKLINESLATCALSLAQSSTDWGSTAFSADGTTFYFVKRFSDGGSTLNVERRSSKLKTGRDNGVFGPPAVSFNWDLFAILDGGGFTFTDLDGLGAAEGTYYLDQTGGPSSNWDTTTPIRGGGDLTSWPAGLAPAWTCPVAFENLAAFLHDPRWIFKWNFSNS